MSEPSFGRGAVETIGRGVQAAPALRRGIGVTLLLALIGAAGRVVIPVLVQQAIDKGFRGGVVRVHTIVVLAAIALVYGSLLAFRAPDLRGVVAYSSIAQMSFVVLGVFLLSQQGATGATFQMVNHALVSAALFLCVGVVYDRMHTREIAFYGGLTSKMPWFAAIFLMFTMANVGLPGTSGFIGEVLTMTGAYRASTWAALIAASGVIFSAVYALTLYRAVMFGEMTNPKLQSITDIDKRELLLFVPLIVGTLWLGVYPGAVLDYTGPAVEALTNAYRVAIGG